MRALNRKAFIGLVAALLAGCGSTLLDDCVFRPS